jgi:hypothetical protein
MPEALMERHDGSDEIKTVGAVMEE